MQAAAATLRGDQSRKRIELLLVTSSIALTLAAYLSPLALALVAGAAVLFLASMRFRPLLLAIIFAMPVNPYLSWNLPIRDLQTLLRLCLFAGAFLARQRAGEPLRPWLFSGRITRAVLGYFAIAVIASTLVNHPTGSAARELMRLGSYLCLYYAILDWVRAERDLKAIVQALLISTISVAIFGFYQETIGGYSSLYHGLYSIQDEALKIPPWSGRITSFLSHYNGLAAYLNMVVPFCIALALRARDKSSRLLGGTCFVLASFAILLTQSRGGLLAYVSILLISACLLPRTRGARVRWVAVVTVFSMASALVAGVIFKRLAGVDSYTEVTRLAIWAGAGILFAGNPILGVGYGNFKTALASAITVPEGFMLDAHNLYLELLAETGVAGFAAFAVLVVICLRHARGMFRDSGEPMSAIVGFSVIAALASVLVHGAVDYVFHNSPQCAAMFFLLLALLGTHEFRSKHAGDRRLLQESA
ncbi:MAG TPA: O-antigen ligase family protein [Candidatus Angelobacter sp.]|nr:O-antigen ligase family protein [Candidatus Angelobacter sp.]